MSATVPLRCKPCALGVVREQLAEATAAKKCHSCGCLHQTVAALDMTEPARTELAGAIADARRVFLPKKYDCLGCTVCYPAIAANAFAEEYPDAAASMELCPTEAPQERRGWPPLPGDYRVLRYGAPVAVCTLNDEQLVVRLADAAPAGLAIVGTMHTENLGIERVIKNTLANPHIRRLVLCGADTRQSVGHLPGQSLQSLFEQGLDESGRIRGASGKRPVLKNVTREEVEAFLRQVELEPMIGESQVSVIATRIRASAEASPGVFDGAPHSTSIAVIATTEPQRLVPDPAGYFVVYPDVRRVRLLVEHFTNAGVLDCVLEGKTSPALYAEIIERGLVTRLDHAAYLGRELARAEHSLRTGAPYTQDRAAGEIPQESIGSAGCECLGARGGGAK